MTMPALTAGPHTVCTDNCSLPPFGSLKSSATHLAFFPPCPLRDIPPASVRASSQSARIISCGGWIRLCNLPPSAVAVRFCQGGSESLSMPCSRILERQLGGRGSFWPAHDRVRSSHAEKSVGRNGPASRNAKCQTYPLTVVCKRGGRAEALSGEAGARFVPLSQRFRVGTIEGESLAGSLTPVPGPDSGHHPASAPGVNARERVQRPVLEGDSERRASHATASSSKPSVSRKPRWQTRCENPPPPAAQSFLDEVQTDLRGIHTSEEPLEGPLFERDEEWEASVFLWKRQRGSQREVGSIFPGTPGPAFQGDNRTYMVEDTGKQLRIKRLGKRDKQGPKRAEREHKRALERRWLEERFGLSLPENKGVKNLVNKIGGWRIVERGWIERIRDTDVARIAKSVGMERAIEREMRDRGFKETGFAEAGFAEAGFDEKGVGESGAARGDFDDIWVTIDEVENENFRGDCVDGIAWEERLAGGLSNDGGGLTRTGLSASKPGLGRGRLERIRQRSDFPDTEQGASDRYQTSPELEKPARKVGVKGSGRMILSGAPHKNGRDWSVEIEQVPSGAVQIERPVEIAKLRRFFKQGPGFARLQERGSAPEVERFSRCAFLEHLETKYGKLHVGRLWRETKVEDKSGWLQIYHDNSLPGYGVVALEPFPESAPVLQDTPPPKFERPYPVTAKMTRRLRALPKSLTRSYPSEGSPESIYVRGRSVNLASTDRFASPREGGSSWWSEEQQRRIEERREKLQGGKALSKDVAAAFSRWKKDRKAPDEAPPAPERSRLGLKVLEWRYARFRRLKKLKKRSDREGGWFERRIHAAAQSRISLVVDCREVAERKPDSEAEEPMFEAVDAVGLVVLQSGNFRGGAVTSEDGRAIDFEKRNGPNPGLTCSGNEVTEQYRGPRKVGTKIDETTAAAVGSFDGWAVKRSPHSSASAPPADVTPKTATSAGRLPRSSHCAATSPAELTSGGATSAGDCQHKTDGSDEDEGFDEWGRGAFDEKPMTVPLRTRDYLTRRFRVLALRVPVEEADALAERLEGHLLHWPRIPNSWTEPSTFADSVSDARNPTRTDAPHPQTPNVCTAKSAVTSKPETLTPRERRETALRRLLRESPRDRTVFDKFGQTEAFVREPTAVGAGLTVLGEVDLDDADVSSAKLPASSSPASETLRPLLSRENIGLEIPTAERANPGAPPGVPTRLLLLDEGLAQRGISYLPKIFRVLMGTCPPEGGLRAVQGAALVACDLTLGYEHWTADEAVRYLVSSGGAREQVEYVGHMAVLYGGGEDMDRKRMIGQVLVDKHPHVRTAIAYPDSFSGRPKLVAGAPSFFTTGGENGVRLEVDLGAVAYDVSLAAERQRLLDTFTPADVICDATAGTGAFAVAAAGRTRFVHASDSSPAALCYLARNAELNGTERKMRLWNLEPEDFVQEFHSASPRCYVTQFVLDLTAQSLRVLAAFRGSFNRGLWGERPLPQVHVYTVAKTDDPEAEITQGITSALGVCPRELSFHHVKATGSGVLTVASFRLPSKCAFDDNLGYE